MSVFDGTVEVHTDSSPPLSSMDEAVWRAVVYADIFDYPLDSGEIGSFLHQVAGRAEIDAAIDRLVTFGELVSTDSLLHLPGREATVLVRRSRAAVAEVMWPRARRYARVLWALPYVRMVAITGSLAVGNVEPGHDIDVLLVTAPGRLWLVRGMAVLLSRLSLLLGDRLCPNYLITTDALALYPQNLYGAHEFARMVPLHGCDAARRLWEANPWYLEFLPQAPRDGYRLADDSLPWPVRNAKRLLEIILRITVGPSLERWERSRKIPRLTARCAASGNESSFTADVCKGHCNGHGRRVGRVFQQRVRAWWDGRSLKKSA